MKLQFKHQKFQEDAARAVVDVFAGQPYLTAPCRTEEGGGCRHSVTGEQEDAGQGNAKIVPGLGDGTILENIRKVQQANGIEPSGKIEGPGYNLTIEMETGVGKTYTYIKTVYELNQAYGWSKFIVVVPGVAVREGVYRAFLSTQEHFAEEYGKKIRFFIYNSAHLARIDQFVSDGSVSVMIINAQAFNARGKDARRIWMRLDEFKSRRPIDVIAAANPILIIDEPQSVEGKQTKESLQAFCPLMTLRYSATHRQDSIYNMVYRLDALDAYNRRLVKKITVKGITAAKTAAADGYVYLEGINLSKSDPTANLRYDFKGASGIRQKTRKAGIGFNLYDASGGLGEYRDGFVVKSIDGRDDSVEFANGIKIHAGDVIGTAAGDQLRRIQIRETILSHIERERQLFSRGIKVLSLFFIDEVAHYKVYDPSGQPRNGIYADMFEEEYRDVISSLQREAEDIGYRRYLESIPAEKTHGGYFSVDKKGRIVNQAAGDDKKNGISNDVDAYDLIMRNKELLLDRDPVKSPVRFIFSHSALREGWDNPNVFQICMLKQSGSDVRRHQEVGRGLRLCVNQDGERMDAGVLGGDVHNVNVLTIIAGESYDSFARGLQTEMAETAYGRPDRFIIPFNARQDNVELKVDPEKISCREFETLWSLISGRSVYETDFDTDELTRRSVRQMNRRLRISPTFIKVESGEMREIGSRDRLIAGTSMNRGAPAVYVSSEDMNQGVKYDLAGELAAATGLTRKTVIRILTGIEKSVFDQFKDNPEEFIMKASGLINEQKAMAVAEHITYKALDARYGTEIFTERTVKGRLGVNAMKARKHLYDHVVYDSAREKDFVERLETAEEVAVYVKLPKGFYISTPLGRFSPDWAVAFRGGTVKHHYFVVKTKGSESSAETESVEEAKIRCARAHFNAVSGGQVVCYRAGSFDLLMRRAMT